jgi:16S rRNA (guanine1207-N2)-methyltransferase
LSTNLRATLYFGVPLSISPRVAPFVNKTVPLRFSGRDLTFCLSHALFSSFDIDDGTRLLLKTLAQRVDMSSLGSVLDVGCGVGVIGACIASRAPRAAVLLQDRDALAAAVAAENCRINALPGAAAECQLAFHGLGERKFDLVTSNLPAKAGAPVLTSMLRHSAARLGPGGIAAVVIVEPLAAFARGAIARLGCELVHADKGRAYSVLHFTAGTAGAESSARVEDLSPYIRQQGLFDWNGIEYSLDTAFSLPDFDTLGHDLTLCFDLLKGLAVSGTAAFWNPGQGHLPAAFLRMPGTRVSTVTLAGRDCLECRITARNLQSMGKPPSGEHLLASEAEIGGAFAEESLDLLVAAPHPVPRSPWQEGLLQSALRTLKPRGKLLVVEKSTEMHRFLQRTAGLTLIADKKRFGYRAALLRKTAEESATLP